MGPRDRRDLEDADGPYNREAGRGLRTHDLVRRVFAGWPGRSVGGLDGVVRLWGDPSAYLAAPALRVVVKTPPGARSNKPPKTATIASPPKPKSAELPPERKPEGLDPWEDFALAKPSPAPGPAIQTALWTQLPKDARPPQLRNKQSAEGLFAKARSSVWVVIATQSVSQSDATSLVSQGSAVAITRSRLLTNYHVVEGQRFIFVKQGDNVFEATVVAGDKEGD